MRTTYSFRKASAMLLFWPPWERCKRLQQTSAAAAYSKSQAGVTWTAVLAAVGQGQRI